MPEHPRTVDCSAASGAAVSSIRLIALAYDLAVLACERKDGEGAVRTVSLLREVMGCAGPDEVADLLGLYDWCVDRIKEGEYALAKQVLTGLRDSWKATEAALLSRPK
jgi:hypothetical protein